MKKILLSVFLFCSLCVNAQSSYNFETENLPYENLTGSISLNNGDVWDDPNYVIPLAFSFMVGSTAINTIYIHEDGLGGGLSTTQSGSGNGIGLLYPIAQDLVDLGFFTESSVSPISYKTIGTAGNFITIIEWKNVGFFDDTTVSDYINFQVWFHEGSNVLEYRYGPSQINNPFESYEEFPGALVAFAPKINTGIGTVVEAAYVLEGSPENPTVHITEPGDEFNGASLIGDIPNGTVYRFTPEPLSINDFSIVDFQIYPNPASNYLNIKTQSTNYNVTIYNSLGQKVNATLSENRIDISNLSDGIYFIKIETETGSAARKFIKQ